ncbi:MAG TPA: hypothetical protein V6D08_15000 [Candidatus Obscuribacterales bacterium]
MTKRARLFASLLAALALLPACRTSSAVLPPQGNVPCVSESITYTKFGSTYSVRVEGTLKIVAVMDKGGEGMRYLVTIGPAGYALVIDSQDTKMLQLAEQLDNACVIVEGELATYHGVATGDREVIKVKTLTPVTIIY